MGAEYNIGDVFAYLLQMKGADIKDFKKPKQQIMFEQANMQWQGAIATIMKANPQVQQGQLPPQPVPADYGLNPDGTPMQNDDSEGKESLIQQIAEAQQQGGENPNEQQEPI